MSDPLSETNVKEEIVSGSESEGEISSSDSDSDESITKPEVVEVPEDNLNSVSETVYIKQEVPLKEEEINEEPSLSEKSDPSKSNSVHQRSKSPDVEKHNSNSADVEKSASKSKLYKIPKVRRSRSKSPTHKQRRSRSKSPTLRKRHSRSKSPTQKRRRSRSNSPTIKRRRSISTSPIRKNRRSRSPLSSRNGASSKPGRERQMTHSERVENIRNSAVSEETRQMNKLMGFSDFYSSKGENDFVLWGSSCVDGKKRENLPDYGDWEKWEAKRLNDRMCHARDEKYGALKGRDSSRPTSSRSYESRDSSSRYRSSPRRDESSSRREATYSSDSRSSIRREREEKPSKRSRDYSPYKVSSSSRRSRSRDREYEPRKKSSSSKYRD